MTTAAAAQPAPRLPPVGWAGLSRDQLLVAVGNGDLGAFGDLYDRTAPLIYGFIRDILPDNNRWQAERITHLTYLYLWRTAPNVNLAHVDAVGRLVSSAFWHVHYRCLPDEGGVA